MTTSCTRWTWSRTRGLMRCGWPIISELQVRNHSLFHHFRITP